MPKKVAVSFSNESLKDITVRISLSCFWSSGDYSIWLGGQGESKDIIADYLVMKYILGCIQCYGDST